MVRICRGDRLDDLSDSSHMSQQLTIPPIQVKATDNVTVCRGILRGTEKLVLAESFGDFVQRLASFNMGLLVVVCDGTSANIVLVQKLLTFLWKSPETTAPGTASPAYRQVAAWVEYCGAHKLGRVMVKVVKRSGATETLRTLSRPFKAKTFANN